MVDQPDIQLVWDAGKTLNNGTSMLTIYLLLTNCALVALLLPKNVNSTRNSIFWIFAVVFVGILFFKENYKPLCLSHLAYMDGSFL